MSAREATGGVALLCVPAESQRMRVCRPRRYLLGNWARARRAVVMWSAAVFEPAFSGRRRAATGSPVPPGPWSTNPIRG